MTIKPCPFCSSNNVEVQYVPEDETFYVLCKKCWAHGPEFNDPNVIDEAAAALATQRWNYALRRPA